MSIKKSLLVILLTIVIEIIFLLSDNLKSDSSKLSLEDRLASLSSGNKDIFSPLLDQVSKIIDFEGVEGAIKLTELALRKEQINIDQCHNLLHLVGHEAYDRLGGNLSKLIFYGSNICIASFQHGVEAQIAETRKDSTEILKKYCSALRQSYPGISCYHGAGHGYMRVLKNPHKSVAKCDELEGGPDKELWNCYRGIFSEYGNQVLGIDADTNLPLPHGTTLKIDRKVPLLFCQEFGEKYRDSCYSQLTKIHSSGDPEASLKSCITEQYSPRMQEICVNTIAGVNSRIMLSGTNLYQISPLVLTLSDNLKKSFIAGFKETLTGFQTSGIKKEWRSFCSQFTNPGDQKYCSQTFQGSL